MGRYILPNISWYGFLITSAIVLSIFLIIKDGKSKGFSSDTFLDIAIYILPSGILGARIYYVIFNLDYYTKYPSEIIKIWNGGLAIYGGIIAGFLAIIIYCKVKKLNTLQILDIIAPYVALSQAIGRWGNFMNAEAYGKLILNDKFKFFPLAVYIEGSGYHMATFFYESVFTISIFIVILYFKYRSFYRLKGSITFLYISLYASARFFVEGLREDSLYLYNFRISQILSLVIIVISLFVYAYYIKKKILYLLPIIVLSSAISVFFSNIYFYIIFDFSILVLYYITMKRVNILLILCLLLSLVCVKLPDYFLYLNFSIFNYIMLCCIYKEANR